MSLVTSISGILLLCCRIASVGMQVHSGESTIYIPSHLGRLDTLPGLTNVNNNWTLPVTHTVSLPGPAGLAVNPLDLHLVSVGRFPQVPRTARGVYSRALGTCLDPPRMSGRAADQA